MLPGCDDLGFTVDSPESSQAKAPHPMPLLPRGFERFDPDFALVDSLLVCFCLMVPFDPFEGVDVKGTVELPTPFA